MILHQNLSVFSVLVRHEYPTLILLLVFSFKNEVESGHPLLYGKVVEPSDFIKIFAFDEILHQASSQFGIAVREVPLRQADSFTCCRVFVLFDGFSGDLDV